MTRPRLLERLALQRPELRAWAMYDWANSALFTVVITAVFPVFYSKVLAADLDPDARRSTFGWATTVSLLVAALISPLLGALADYARVKKKVFALFLAVGVLSTAGMWFLRPGDWVLGCVLFGLANIGAAGSFVFYDALLSHVAREGELDQLSSTAYAVGYLGGGLCLALCVWMIQQPATFGLASGDSTLPARTGFLVVALWWALFTIPFFRQVSEPAPALEPDEQRGMNPVRVAFTRLSETLRELRRWRAAFLMMIAFLIYNDGIGTVIRMATLFGEERRIPEQTMLGAILVVQFVGIPCAILFGRLAGRIGAKRAIQVALLVYVGIAFVAYGMDTVGEFWTMAVLVGTVQGGAQALSRSLFASLVPKHKSAEFFGLFSTLEKFAGVIGPAVFSVSASSGAAILSLIAFFVVGGAILACVDVSQGQALAREAERALHS
jgi:UMF1 family MFS transporter